MLYSFEMLLVLVLMEADIRKVTEAMTTVTLLTHGTTGNRKKSQWAALTDNQSVNQYSFTQCSPRAGSFALRIRSHVFFNYFGQSYKLKSSRTKGINRRE